MKRNSYRKRAAALALASTLLAGCGASSTPVNGITNPLPGGGYYGGGVGGCVPINQAISFTGTGVSLSGADIRAGRSPFTGQAYGTMAVGYGSGAISTSFNYYRNGVVDGSIGFNATNTNGTIFTPTYPTSTVGTANITGVLQISTQAQQAIISSAGYGTGYNNGNVYGGTSVPCVSGMAINSFLETSVPSRLYNGYVYLYLNNTQNYYALYF